MTAVLTPLFEQDSRQGDGYGVAPAEIEYARLLFASGIGLTRICELLALDYDAMHMRAFRQGWTRRTPCRRGVEIGCRIAVLVRCGVCCARFGEELGASRPCPHCGALERGDV